MSCRFARFSLAIVLISCGLAAVWASEPPQAASQQELLVLRNGEVLSGRITGDDGYYRVALADGELRVRVSEAELICHNLDEAYSFKRNRLALGRADDHLDLADWCLRQGLPGYAAKEISSAMALDSHNPRTEFLDRRLRQMLETPPPAHGQKAAEIQHVTNEDLDRLVRGMPPGAVEAFTATIQPLLMNSCATSGCHGPGSKSTYIILRIPGDRTGTRRLTQRNLQSTVQMLDYQNPQQSRLLAAASRSHGTAASAIFDPQTVKYRQLYNWIALVTQKVPGAPDLTEQPATVGIGGRSTYNLNQSSDAFTADGETRPARSPYHSRAAKAIAARGDADTSRKEHSTQLPQPVVVPGASAGAPAADAGDPFDAEAFNRRFADPPANGPNSK